MHPATLLPLLLFGLLSFTADAYAGDPCCAIVSFEPGNGIVTARDAKTGRTFSFQADALDKKGIKVGDKVDADLASGKLTSLKGVSRTYAVFEPDAAAPCCDIVSIQPDPFEPGNGIVTARDTKTGRTFQFSATAALKNELKVGQAVGLNQTNHMASVHSAATGAKGKPATYSYPVKGAAGCPESLTAQWERIGGAPRPGQTGRLLVALPEGAHYIVNIFKQGKKVKQLKQLKQFDLFPGDYEVKISNAGVPNVPILRGCDTRVRAGVHNVTLAKGQAWNVYDEGGKIKVESGRGPEKIGLLVGKYQMRIGKDSSPFEIKDKATASMEGEVSGPGTPPITASEGSTAGAIPDTEASGTSLPGRLGILSPASENEDGQPDPASPAAHSAAATTKAFNRANTKHVKDLHDVQKFFASLGHEVEQLNLNVALVGGNKYMVNDCLGIKASAGQFSFHPGAPSLRLDGSGILMQFVVDRVSLDGLSVRVRPNASNPAKLCKFSKRFGVGGSASSVRFEIRVDPLLDLRECRVLAAGGIRQSFAIGGFNLRPLQNDLDKVAKNMIEEAINYYLDGPSYQELMMQATARALKTTCTGGV